MQSGIHQEPEDEVFYVVPVMKRGRPRGRDREGWVLVVAGTGEATLVETWSLGGSTMAICTWGFRYTSNNS